MAMRPGTPMQGMARGRQDASSRLASLGLPSSPGQPTPDQGKRPLGDVNYRAADTPTQACGNCDFFTPPESCDLVAGNIDPKAVCDLWAPVDRSAEPPGAETPAEDLTEEPAGPMMPGRP